jgi:hypothetical protein
VIGWQVSWNGAYMIGPVRKVISVVMGKQIGRFSKQVLPHLPANSHSAMAHPSFGHADTAGACRSLDKPV